MTLMLGLQGGLDQSREEIMFDLKWISKACTIEY